jgi:hypothetical protein
VISIGDFFESPSVFGNNFVFRLDSLDFRHGDFNAIGDLTRTRKSIMNFISSTKRKVTASAAARPSNAKLPLKAKLDVRQITALKKQLLHKEMQLAVLNVKRPAALRRSWPQMVLSCTAFKKLSDSEVAETDSSTDLHLGHVGTKVMVGEHVCANPAVEFTCQRRIDSVSGQDLGPYEALEFDSTYARVRQGERHYWVWFYKQV